MVYMYHSFLIHSSADGHPGCFQVLAIINSAAMNIGVHVSLSDLVSSVCMPRSGIAESYGSSYATSLYFSMIQCMLAISVLVLLPFLNPACTSEHSWYMYCWNLEGFWTLCDSKWNDCTCAVAWTFIGIALLWDYNENWPFPVLWPVLSFPNLLAYWGQHFNTNIF